MSTPGDQVAAAPRRRRPRSGSPLIGIVVSTLLLVSVALLLIVPLLSATRSLAQRRSVDRLVAAAGLPATIERAAAAAIEGTIVDDPSPAPDWRAPAERARRIAARLAGVAESAPPAASEARSLSAALTPLDEMPGGTEAAFTVLAHVDDLIAAAEAAEAAESMAVDDPDLTEPQDSAPARAAIRVARNDAIASAEILGDLLRRDTARGLAGLLRFDGGVLAVVVLLGLLQVALLVRMRRLNAGLHAEIDRRVASEERLRDRESELERTAEALRSARDDAQAADRAKSRFLATMSHEFRTPLNGILGFTWLIERGLQAARPEDVRADVQRIRGAGEHMLRLVSDVLDLAKVEAGMMEPAIAPFDAGALVEEIAAAAEPVVTAGGSRFLTDLQPLGSATTDATRIRQVIDNLLSNAGRFTEDGTVHLLARRLPAGAAVPPDAITGETDAEAPGDPADPDAPDDAVARHRVGTLPAPDVDRLLVSVRDSGPGMSPGELAAAFDEFVQVDDSVGRRHGGTGLGLALVARFATILGGAVVVTSRPGSGTVCTLIIPAALDAGADPRSVSPSEESPS